MAQSDKVHFSIFQRFFRDHRIVEFSVADYRNAYHIFYRLAGIQLESFVLINRRNLSIVSFITSGINMDRIYACFINDLGDFQTFVQSSVVRKFRHTVIRCEFYDNREVRSADFFHFLDTFNQETASVFQASAVFIRSLIPFFCQELVDNITAVSVDFNSVRARFLRQHGASSHTEYQSRDMFFFKRLAHQIREVSCRTRACRIRRVFRIRVSHSSESRSDLNDNFRTFLVNLIAQKTQPVSLMEAFQSIGRSCFKFGTYHIQSGKNKSGSAGCSLTEILDATFFKTTVYRRLRSHWCHADPVLYLHTSNLSLFK